MTNGESWPMLITQCLRPPHCVIVKLPLQAPL
jgi:hypothetical protein